MNLFTYFQFLFALSANDKRLQHEGRNAIFHFTTGNKANKYFKEVVMGRMPQREVVLTMHP